ncbi:NUDIX domain-containing protein [Flammula alnicola]|nr:NUDIX domain-containing protein [Flammula alnicola]
MAPSTVPTPRPSASLVIVNERNEILLVHRNPKSSSFGGMHVFPGGNFDKKQDQSLAITAIRETFEESGLLLASSVFSGPLPSDAVLDEARNAIHQQKLLFQTFLESQNLKADGDSLLPFTQWITPVGPWKRFHTQFYVVFLPAAPSSGFSSGAKQERIPKHDGGQEVIEARFVHPRKALEECYERKVGFMPPQHYILSTLADILHGSINTSDYREKVKTLSRSLFGRMVINPRKMGEEQDGHVIITYEGDELREGSKGRLHRAMVKMDRYVFSTGEISMIRNFDIFTEIEAQAFSNSAKL